IRPQQPVLPDRQVLGQFQQGAARSGVRTCAETKTSSISRFGESGSARVRNRAPALRRRGRRAADWKSMNDYLQLLQTYFPYVAKGSTITLQLTIVQLLGSLALGLLTTCAKLANLRMLRVVATLYIELIRATPALLQLFIIYFGLASFG